MIESFRQLINRLKDLPLQRVCVAGAGHEEILKTVRDALDEGVARITLVGQQDQIWRVACNISLDLNQFDVIHEPDPQRAAAVAAEEAAHGRADVIMKGMVESAGFLGAVSAREHAGSGAILSYIAAYEIPGYDRLVYITDGGLNASPDFEQKLDILKNAVTFLHSLGLETPRVALISANEKVSPKMPVTVEAQKLAAAVNRGLAGGALAEGPMALDVAVSREAARQKRIKGPVAGSADLIFVPNIEVGDTIGKIITHVARGKMGAVVLGAGRPVVLAAKNENRFGRLCSLALACYSSARPAVDASPFNGLNL